MPTNPYGPADNFYPENSHVLLALIRRINEAKQAGKPEVVIRGTGNPRREFLHVDDMAAASLSVLDLEREAYAASTQSILSHINVGCGENISILALARLVAGVIGYEGSIVTDLSKPGGTMGKLTDIGWLQCTGWGPRITLSQGMADTYRWYLRNIVSVRS